MIDTSARLARIAPTTAEAAEGAIILVNSLGTTSAMWDELVPLLRASFDVVRYEQRGYRADDTGPGEFGIDQLADDLFAVLDSLEIASAHVAGTSLGGMVAVHAAARRPSRVLTVAMICASPVLPSDTWLERADIVRRAGLEAIRTTVLERWFTPQFAIASPDVVNRFADMLQASDPEQYARACEMLAATDIRGDLARVTSPTLIIGGAADVATPPDDQAYVAERIRGSQLDILEGVAHMATAAAPAAIAHKLLRHAQANGRKTQ